MGVILNRIGTSISCGKSHNGMGKIVSFPSVPAGFPPAGSINSILNDIEYPVAHGGAEVTYQHPDTLYYYSTPNQTCDLYVKNDGAGGTYEDWDYGAFDVKYKAYGVYAGSFSDVGNFITISGNCTSSNNYPNGTRTVTFYHDGIAGTYSETTAYSYSEYGHQFFYEECTDENANTYTTTYYSDGAGGYFT